jgi:osmotically inducible protein OsmC
MTFLDPYPAKGERTMNNHPEILYTAEATVTGGREGHARTSDGRLDVDLDVPSEMGGTGGPGTNPEQLFAAGWAACFQSSMMRFAVGRKIDLSGSRITARVGIGQLKSGGFGLAAALVLEAPAIGRDDAFDLMRLAHETCPYSRATRGNIEVTLTVGGTTMERQAA